MSSHIPAQSQIANRKSQIANRKSQIIMTLTLAVCLWTPAAAHAESPPKPPCNCDDDCAAHGWAGAYCVIYGSGYGYCSWSGPGKPCTDAGSDLPPMPEPPTKEQGPPLPPEAGPPEWGYQNQEPGYPESDPWYEDMKAVNPSPDGGPEAPADGGENGELPHRGGCSVHRGPGSFWLLVLLPGLVCLARGRRRGLRG